MSLADFVVSLCACSLSRVQVFVTLWTGAHQAPLSMGFFRQEYWSGLSCPPLPHRRIEPASPTLQMDSLPRSHQGSLWFLYRIIIQVQRGMILIRVVSVLVWTPVLIAFIQSL